MRERLTCAILRILRRPHLQRTRCAHVADTDALSYLARPSGQWANQYAYTICDGPAVPKSRDMVLLLETPLDLPPETLEDDAWEEARRRTVPPRVAETAFRWALPARSEDRARRDQGRDEPR